MNFSHTHLLFGKKQDQKLLFKTHGHGVLGKNPTAKTKVFA